LSKIKYVLLMLCGIIIMNFSFLRAADNYLLHTVKKGDTLYSLSKQYGVTVQEIKDLNGLNSNRLDIGQKLKIKTLAEPAAKPSSPVVKNLKQSVAAEEQTVTADFNTENYKVKRGDNLGKIAAEHDMTLQELKTLNNLTGNQIKAGQLLKVKAKAKTPSAQKSIQSVQEEIPPLVTRDEYQIYTVKKGDTLSGIARTYGVTVDDIKKLNNMKSNRLSIGQNLKIKPAPAKSVATSETKTSAKRAEPKTAPADTSVLAAGKQSAVSAEQIQQDLSSVALPNEYYHIVQPKETLFRIAVNAGITLDELRRINNFPPDFTSIKIGQKIIIKDPSSYLASLSAPVTTDEEQTENEEENPSLTPEDSVLIEKVYIVQPKDNLFRIAKNNNMTVEELKKLNNLKSNTIKVGQKLYIKAPKGKQEEKPLPPPLTEEELKAKTKLRTDLIMPVDGKVISEFGIRNGRPHKGIDLGAQTGSPIYAVLDGTVVFSGVQGSYGNVVVIEHPEYVMTVYAHNEKNLVSVGETVKQGQVIGTVGSTGNATCSHVHFEYRIKGKAINPRKVLP